MLIDLVDLNDLIDFVDLGDQLLALAMGLIERICTVYQGKLPGLSTKSQ